MSVELGKRYERLMMSSAPLVVASIFLLFTSFAAGTKSDVEKGRCYELAAKSITDEKDAMDAAWATKKSDRKKGHIHPDNYAYLLRMNWINSEGFYDCSQLEQEVFAAGDTEPSALVAAWQAKASDLHNAPLELVGISVQSETEVTILGTKVKIKLATLTAALQIALGPLLIIWMGSLYATRHRETILIAKAQQLTEVYPHFINTYPAVNLPALRKRRAFALWITPTNAMGLLYALWRTFLVIVALTPTVAFYLLSLALQAHEDMHWGHLVLGVGVSMFALSVVTTEVLPWHVFKVFPSLHEK